jgi:hypothetical protein
MTANELADWIENGAPFGEYKTAKQASAMLRQQQAEIEALKLRELTDREIASVCKEHLAPKNCDIYTFARAILQKASEK